MVPTAGPSAVAEREALFQPPKIGLGAHAKAQASGTGFEIRVADRACHFPALRIVGNVLGNIRRRMSVYHRER